MRTRGVYEQPKWARWLTPLWWGSLLLAVLGYWRQDRFPPLAALDPALFQAPLQTETTRPPFFQTYAEKRYLITPRFAYTLRGLVVSYNDLSETWASIVYPHDPLNTKDLCVLFGASVAAEAYAHAKFTSEGFRCFVQYPLGAPFRDEDLSNNHMLPSTLEVARRLQQVRVGDQIQVQGALVDYQVGAGGARRTSTTRTDTGDGACEVFYIDALQILRRNTPVWRFCARWGVIALGVTALLWFYATFLHFFFEKPPEPTRAPCD